jgi:CRP/FNR family cyclic AMP-dependent transcriptional regulator
MGKPSVPKRLPGHSEPLKLDVRTWTTAERYERMLYAFQKLEEGASLRIIVDHEPKAMRLRLDAVHTGRHVWAQRKLGDDLWEATVMRVAPLASGAMPNETILHCSPLFTGLDTSARQSLARAACERLVDVGECIAEQGTIWPYVGLVVAGSVAGEVITDGGRGYNLYTAYPCDIFGEIGAIDCGSTVARFVASTAQTLILLLPRDLVLELADADGTFARRLATICAQRARLTHEMLYSRVTKSTLARLAAALLPYATRATGPTRALDPLPSMTQSELASAVGTVKDVVGRDLSALRDAGAVDLRGGRVVRIDVAKLRTFL